MPRTVTFAPTKENARWLQGQRRTKKWGVLSQTINHAVRLLREKQERKEAAKLTPSTSPASPE